MLGMKLNTETGKRTTRQENNFNRNKPVKDDITNKQKMKLTKTCPKCGKKMDPRGFQTHLNSHRFDHKYNTQKPPELAANPVEILLELEKQTKSAVSNLRQTRDNLTNQVSQIDSMLKKYDETHPAKSRT